MKIEYYKQFRKINFFKKEDGGVYFKYFCNKCKEEIKSDDKYYVSMISYKNICMKCYKLEKLKE